MTQPAGMADATPFRGAGNGPFELLTARVASIKTLPVEAEQRFSQDAFVVRDLLGRPDVARDEFLGTEVEDAVLHRDSETASEARSIRSAQQASGAPPVARHTWLSLVSTDRRSNASVPVSVRSICFAVHGDTARSIRNAIRATSGSLSTRDRSGDVSADTFGQSQGDALPFEILQRSEPHGGHRHQGIEAARFEKILGLIDGNREADSGITLDSCPNHANRVPLRSTTGPPLLPGLTVLLICRTRRSPLSSARSAEIVPAEMLISGTRVRRGNATDFEPSTKRIPEGFHALRRSQDIGVAERHVRKVGGGDEQHREIERRIRGMDGRFETASQRAARARGRRRKTDVDPGNFERELGITGPSVAANWLLLITCSLVST